MRILTCKNNQELAIQTEVLLRDLIQIRGQTLRGFFPTGRSVEGLYALLRQNADFWSRRFQVLQIDEFVGAKQLFYQKLKEQLIDPLSLGTQQEVIDPSWTDEQMANHIADVLRKPIDFALLGLGPNGHIGFHEPGTHGADFLGGRMHLSESSFTRVPGAPNRWALTFGAGAFLKAKRALMIVTGPEKEKIFQEFLRTPPTAGLPATLLKNHSDFTVLTTFSGASVDNK